MTSFPFHLQIGPAASVAVGVFLLLLAVWVALVYNRLVVHVHLVEEGWSGIDAQFERRHDLVGQLLEVVRE